MRPAFSVVFLTTLIGVGQGILTALVMAQYLHEVDILPAWETPTYYATGTLVALVFLSAGLLSSFFHLAHPERAWRTITRWRTSWLSKEVIVLPGVVGLAAIYGALQWLGWDPKVIVLGDVPVRLSLIVGVVTIAASFVLFICTGMIYASVKFIQQWASWLTVVNYILMGLASGFTVAAAHAVWANSPLTGFMVWGAFALTLVAFVMRAAAVYRNGRIKRKSDLGTAIGVHHPNIRQVTQGFMGGSFNTHEFTPGADKSVTDNVHWLFLPIAFLFPAVVLGAAWATGNLGAVYAAALIQYAGLVLERWGFFAQGQHPQNLYYQATA
jgi:DMSO reductase anchor subunit